VSISMISCHKANLKEEFSSETKPMKDIIVGPNFTWETTKIIDVSLSASHAGVVYVSPVEGDYYFYKGALFSGTSFTTQLTVPSYLEEVKLIFKGAVHVVDLKNNRLEFNFN